MEGAFYSVVSKDRSRTGAPGACPLLDFLGVYFCVNFKCTECIHMNFNFRNRRVKGNIPPPNGDINSFHKDHGLQRGSSKREEGPHNLQTISEEPSSDLFPHAFWRLVYIRALQIRIQHPWKCLKGVFEIYRNKYQ